MQFVSKLLISFTLASTLAVSPALAARTACPEHFAYGQAPDFINRKLSEKAREVCYSAFAVEHSGVTRTPLYAAEHLTRDRLYEGRGLKRESQFHPDHHIPASQRAELRHYARSGYDRGHMAPAADMCDPQALYECFTLANMVPQVPENNRGLWAGIESAVRMMTKRRGELYVVTGPIFQGGSIERIGGAVMVPTKLFKAIYDPQRKEAGAYLIDNADQAAAEKISVEELEKVAGISIFPSVGDHVKQRLMNLPNPRSFKEGKRNRGR